MKITDKPALQADSVQVNRRSASYLKLNSDPAPGGEASIRNHLRADPEKSVQFWRETSLVMGASFSEPCCGTNRRAMEELVPPLRSISVLEDDRVHFLNDSPMCCLVKNSLWEQNMTAIKDVNGTTLFHVNAMPGDCIQLILPTLSCHADVTADVTAGCWYICMGRERRVVIKKHLSSESQLIFLVHALKQPFPSRDSLHTLPLPHPCLSVRGDFFSREYSVFDCSGLDARRVARSVSSFRLGF